MGGQGSSVQREKTERVIAALNVNFRRFIRYLLTRINDISRIYLSFNVLPMVTSHEKLVYLLSGRYVHVCRHLARNCISKASNDEVAAKFP